VLGGLTEHTKSFKKKVLWGVLKKEENYQKFVENYVTKAL